MGPAASCIRAPNPSQPDSHGNSKPKSTENVTAAASSKPTNVEKQVAVAEKPEKAPTTAVESTSTSAISETKVNKIYPQVGSSVSTPYGLGVLNQLRPDGFCVVFLDFGAKAFLNKDQVRFAPLPEVGSQVSTLYGDGMMQTVREDGFVVVDLKFGAKAFLRKDQVRAIRAYPFVPASYWTSGIFETSERKIISDTTSKAVDSPAIKRVQEELREEPAPALPSEEKDSSEVPPPANPEPPAEIKDEPKTTEPGNNTSSDNAEHTQNKVEGDQPSKKKKKKQKN